MYQARISLECPPADIDPVLEARTRSAKTKSLLEKLRRARKQYAKARESGDREASAAADAKVNRLRGEWRYFQATVKASNTNRQLFRAASEH